MSLTPRQETRRDYLISRGERGATNQELHELNVLNNADRSDEELFETAKDPNNIQAINELRDRGYDI